MANRVDLVSGVLPPGVPDRSPHARARARARHGLALARPRAAQAPRLVAGARGGRGLRGRAPCEGPRLRGVDGAPDPADRAPARPPAVRRARRPGDDPPAGAGRRGLRAVPAAPDGVRLRQRRLLRAHRGGAAAGDGGPCVPGALAVAEADPGGGARGAATETVRRRSSRSTATTAWRTSRCVATRATSSPSAAGRSSRIASSAGRRSSPATRSAPTTSATS